LYYEERIRRFLALNLDISKGIKAFGEIEAEKKKLEERLARLGTYAGTRVGLIEANLIHKINALEASLKSLKKKQLDDEEELELLRQNLAGFRISVDEVLCAAIPDYCESDYTLLCKNSFRLLCTKPITAEVCMTYNKRQPQKPNDMYFIVTVVEKKTGAETVFQKMYSIDEVLADGTPLADSLVFTTEPAENKDFRFASMELSTDKIKHLFLGAEDFRYSIFLQKNISSICKWKIHGAIFVSPHNKRP